MRSISRGGRAQYFERKEFACFPAKGAPVEVHVVRWMWDKRGALPSWVGRGNYEKVPVFLCWADSISVCIGRPALNKEIVLAQSGMGRGNSGRFQPVPEGGSFFSLPLPTHVGRDGTGTFRDVCCRRWKIEIRKKSCKPVAPLV